MSYVKAFMCFLYPGKHWYKKNKLKNKTIEFFENDCKEFYLKLLSYKSLKKHIKYITQLFYKPNYIPNNILYILHQNFYL